MPPILPALGAISAVAGIASTVQGLSAAASNKKEIRIKNEAASLANQQLGSINIDLRSLTKQTNQTLRQGFTDESQIIKRSNKTISGLNKQVQTNIDDANKQIGIANEAAEGQVELQKDQQELNALQSKRQAIREAQILAANQESVAQNTGAGDSSAEFGGASSLQSQLGDVLGFQSQGTSIARDISELDALRVGALNEAQELERNAQSLRNKAVEEQRQTEVELRLQQNKTQRRLSNLQTKIELIRNDADRIREQASLDPRKFLRQNGRKIAPIQRVTVNDGGKRNNSPAPAPAPKQNQLLTGR